MMPKKEVSKFSWRGGSFSNSSKSLKTKTKTVKPKSEKNPASKKVAPDQNRSPIPSEEIYDNAGDGNKNKILSWGTMARSFGYEQLDIKDYEYRTFSAFLSKHIIEPNSDRLSVATVSKVLIDFHVVKTESEGSGLCRRLNSTEESTTDISMGDLIHAGRYNKKNDGDMIRRLVRAINEWEIDRVLDENKAKKQITEGTEAIGEEGAASPLVQKTLSKGLRKMISRLSSRNLDEPKPKAVPERRGNVKKRLMGKVLSLVRLRKVVSKTPIPVPAPTSKAQKYGVPIEGSGRYYTGVKDGDSFSDRFSARRGTAAPAKKVAVVKIIHKKSEEEEPLSAREQQVIDDYLRQFDDVQDFEDES